MQKDFRLKDEFVKRFAEKKPNFGFNGLELNKLLCQWKVQYKQSGVYYLYSEFRPLKYAAHYPYVYTTASGNVITKNRLKWTEKGKEFIINLYNQKVKNKRMERVD